MLIVFSGLPGTGKTTLARAFVQQRHAVYLSGDTIDHGLRSAASIAGDSRTIVYDVAYALASANLALAQIVVVDSVNDQQAQREAWRRIAAAADAPIFEVEMICSDSGEHRRRVETRTPAPENMDPPTWREVVERPYDAWDRPHLIIDTAKTSSEEAFQLLSDCVRRGSLSGISISNLAAVIPPKGGCASGVGGVFRGRIAHSCE